VIALLLLLHALRGEDDEDRIFVQEVVDQDAAYLIIEPLLLLAPVLALRIVKLVYDPETPLIGVVSQPVLEEGLVVVKPFDSELIRVVIFLEETGC
jgi:hypothetical protein